MKQSNVIVREKLVVGYWELTPMESGAGFSAPQDTATGKVKKYIPAANKQRTSWWTE